MGCVQVQEGRHYSLCVLFHSNSSTEWRRRQKLHNQTSQHLLMERQQRLSEMRPEHKAGWCMCSTCWTDRWIGCSSFLTPSGCFPNGAVRTEILLGCHSNRQPVRWLEISQFTNRWESWRAQDGRVEDIQLCVTTAALAERNRLSESDILNTSRSYYWHFNLRRKHVTNARWLMGNLLIHVHGHNLSVLFLWHSARRLFVTLFQTHISGSLVPAPT